MDKTKMALKKALEKLSFLKKYFFLLWGNKRAFWGALVGFLACFVLLSAVVGVAIYKSKSRNTFVKAWASVIPYPAAVIRWRIITYADYLKDLSALEHFYARQQEATGLPAPIKSELEQAVLDRLIRNIALKQVAAVKDLSLSQEEIDKKFNETVADVGTKEEAEKLILDLYGWDSETFTKRVLVYYMLEQKLGASFQDAAAFEEAMKVEIAKLKETRFFGK